jgi:hypothetical protein
VGRDIPGSGGEVTPLYPKIDSVFKRDPATNHRTFLMGEWANPVFGYLKDAEWHATEKVDGTNCRIHLYGELANDDGLVAEWGGRTLDAQLHPQLELVLGEIATRALDLKDERYHGLTLFGEGYGAGIQKGGGNYRSDKGFILFDVQVNSTGTWLEYENVVDIAETLGIPVAPLVFVGSLGQAVWHFENHRPITTNSILMDNELAEGWVLRPGRELRDRMGHRVITKMKVKDFPR